MDADIVKFFDSIDCQILLGKLRQHIEHPGILCLIKAWISSGIINNQVERILLFGNINLSTPAIATCLESQINVGEKILVY